MRTLGQVIEELIVEQIHVSEQQVFMIGDEPKKTGCLVASSLFL